MKTFVISSKKFSSLQKAYAQIQKWENKGTLDKKAKIYEIKTAYKIKHKPLKNYIVSHGLKHHPIDKPCKVCRKIAKEELAF